MSIDAREIPQPKIKSIIPAVGWFVGYHIKEEPFYAFEPLVCWAMIEVPEYEDDYSVEGLVAIGPESLLDLADCAYVDNCGFYFAGYVHESQVERFRDVFANAGRARFGRAAGGEEQHG